LRRLRAPQLLLAAVGSIVRASHLSLVKNWGMAGFPTINAPFPPGSRDEFYASGPEY